MVDTSNDNMSAAFKQKAAFMKTWKPQSTPSNRDRLELYALHKQAISGDAPSSNTTTTPADKAKYQAWKAKAGLSMSDAMQQYVREAERQINMYGQHPSQTPQSTPALENNNSQYDAPSQQPRGLAALPLLCAAASESRPAYLRRIGQTQASQSWWRRQEALCARPGTFWALPEATLIGVAALLERVALSCEGFLPIPAPIVQSFLWPFHNSFLCLWMGLIVCLTAWNACIELCQTLVWGSRRTGLTLPGLWRDEIQWNSTSVYVLTEAHQPLTARLVGLVLLPYTVLVKIASIPPTLWASLAYVIFMCTTWWYWVMVLPWLTTVLLFFAFISGNCFALIELAGV